MDRQDGGLHLGMCARSRLLACFETTITSSLSKSSRTRCPGQCRLLRALVWQVLTRQQQLCLEKPLARITKEGHRTRLRAIRRDVPE
eukprot:759338-Hanusia_phi.AAC.4